jgi:SAM-dependent methyltransferase
MSSASSGQYAFGHSDRELERLTRQGALIEPFTRQLFLEAGLTSGMRVLDVGSGVGDVAMLAAEIVGANGEVIGTDKSAKAVAAAQARAVKRGLGNIQFFEGDPAEMHFDRAFDAVVGRFVLAHSLDPAEMLRKLRCHARPGALIIFQEPDHTGAHSSVQMPLFAQGMRWIVDVIRASGRQPDTGLRLFSIYIAAGLPVPKMRYDSLIATPADSRAIWLGVETIRSYLPLMEKSGIATAAEVDIDTLEQRSVDELTATGAVIVCPATVGAWCRLPA